MCMRVHKNAHAYTYVCMRVCSCVYVCVCVCVRVCVLFQFCLCPHISHISYSLPMSAASLSSLTDASPRSYCLVLSLYIYIYIYIYKHTHTHMSTCIHTHTHTHTPATSPPISCRFHPILSLLPPSRLVPSHMCVWLRMCPFLLFPLSTSSIYSLSFASISFMFWQDVWLLIYWLAAAAHLPRSSTEQAVVLCDCLN